MKLCNIVIYVTMLIIVVLILDWNTRFGSERGTSSGTDWVAETKRSVCTSSRMTSFMWIFFFTVSVVESYTFYVGLFILLRICLESAVDGIVKRDHSNESYWAVLSFGTVCYAVLVVLTFESVDQFILKCDSFKWKPWAVFSCGSGF